MFKFDLLENEKLITMYRQTEWILLKPAALVLVLIYLPWYFTLKYELVADYQRLLLAWTALVFLYAIYKYVIWLLNVNLLTSHRIIQVKYLSLVRKKVTEVPLPAVVNISFLTSGALSSLFGYGDVEVQIANSAQPIVLENLRQPAKIKDILWKAHIKDNQAQNRHFLSPNLAPLSSKPENQAQKRKIV